MTQQGQDGEQGEHPHEQARTANTVGDPPADGAHGRGEDDEPGGSHAGVLQAEAKMTLQQRGQIDAQGHEAAEGDEVKEGQRPGHALVRQDSGDMAQWRGAGRDGIARACPEDQRPHEAGGAKEPEHRFPGEGLRQSGREEDGNRLADIARAKDTEGQSLLIG